MSAILFLKQALECCTFCTQAQVVVYCIDELLLSKYLCLMNNDRLSEGRTMSNKGHIVRLSLIMLPLIIDVQLKWSDYKNFAMGFGLEW